MEWHQKIMSPDGFLINCNQLGKKNASKYYLHIELQCILRSTTAKNILL